MRQSCMHNLKGLPRHSFKPEREEPGHAQVLLFQPRAEEDGEDGGPGTQKHVHVRKRLCFSSIPASFSHILVLFIKYLKVSRCSLSPTWHKCNCRLLQRGTVKLQTCLFQAMERKVLRKEDTDGNSAGLITCHSGPLLLPGDGQKSTSGKRGLTEM